MTDSPRNLGLSSTVMRKLGYRAMRAARHDLVEGLAFSDEGVGPAVLVLHGGFGGIDQGAILAEAALPPDRAFRRIIVARPGYFASALAGRETPVAQADAYAALLRRLGITACLVLAISAGGPSALQFGLRHPDLCRGLVLISACSGPLPVPEAALKRLKRFKLFARLPGLAALGRWALRRNPRRAAARGISDPKLCAATLADPVAGPLLARLQRSVMTAIPQRLPGTLNDIAVCQAFTLPAALPLTAPLLLLHGTADPIVPVDQARALADRLPQARFVPLTGAEHMALFSHLHPIRQTVATFLDAL